MDNRSVTLNLYQGSTFTLPFNFNNPDGTPMDVSLWVFKGVIKDNYSDATITACMTFTAGVDTNQVIATIASGVTTLIAVNTTTSFKLDPTPYCYDVIATLPDGSVMKIMQGSVFVYPAVTVLPCC
jgi:hypothetical protein